MVALVIADHLMRQKLLRNKTPVARVRDEIDLADRMIVMLLSHRQELVREVGKWKRERRTSIPDPRREQKILDAILSLAGEARLDPSFLKKLYRTIFEYSRAVQITL
jgi:chorismate mutase